MSDSPPPSNPTFRLSYDQGRGVKRPVSSPILREALSTPPNSKISPPPVEQPRKQQQQQQQLNNMVPYFVPTPYYVPFPRQLNSLVTLQYPNMMDGQEEQAPPLTDSIQYFELQKEHKKLEARLTSLQNELDAEKLKNKKLNGDLRVFQKQNMELKEKKKEKEKPWKKFVKKLEKQIEEMKDELESD